MKLYDLLQFCVCVLSLLAAGFWLRSATTMLPNLTENLRWDGSCSPRYSLIRCLPPPFQQQSRDGVTLGTYPRTPIPDASNSSMLLQLLIVRWRMQELIQGGGALCLTRCEPLIPSSETRPLLSSMTLRRTEYRPM